jgi:hypothetical protein
MSGIFSFSSAAFRVLSLFLHCVFQLQHSFLLFLVVAKQSIKFSVGYYPELTVSQISKSSVRGYFEQCYGEGKNPDFIRKFGCSVAFL